MNDIVDNSSFNKHNGNSNTESINYHTFSKSELVSELKKVINHDNDIKKITIKSNLIKSAFYKNPAPETGNRELEEKFKDLYNQIKKLKSSSRQKEERIFSSNLKTKQAIIEEIGLLTKNKTIVKSTFEKLYDLQKKWKNTGEIAVKDRNDLWNSYQYNIELFYDFVSINRELRDLDFKKNLRNKELLCQKAEALKEKKSYNNAYIQLQELHELWKNIGPVDKKYRGEIWERFQNASKFINRKRNDYFLEIKKNNTNAKKIRDQICQKISALSRKENTTHESWQQTSKIITDLEVKWKQAAISNKKENNIYWKSFREVLSEFYDKRNKFYKNLKSKRKSEIDQKNIIYKEALSLKDSQEWEQTTKRIIQLQLQWKKLDHTSNKSSKLLWKKFNNSCNAFFESKRNQLKIKKENQRKSIKENKNLLEKINKDPIQNKKQLNTFLAAWYAVNLDFTEYKSLEDDLKKITPIICQNLKISEEDLQKIKFEKKINSFTKENQKKINNEKIIIQKKIDSKHKDILQYQNNINFLSNSKQTNQLKSHINSKINEFKNDVLTLESQLDLLKKL